MNPNPALASTLAPAFIPEPAPAGAAEPLASPSESAVLPASVTAAPARERRFVFWSLLAAAVLFVITLVPLWKPLLLAGVTGASVSKWHERAARFMGGRRWLSAAVFTVVISLLVVLPLAGVAAVASSQADDAAASLSAELQKGRVAKLIAKAPPPLDSWLRQGWAQATRKLDQLSSPRASSEMLRNAWGGLSLLGGMAVQFAMWAIALFAFLLDGVRLKEWLARFLPLPSPRTQFVMQRFRATARTVLGANLLTSLAQAALATIGYLLTPVPQPLFFGLLTFLTSFFPAIGTAIVAIPLSTYLLIAGHPAWAAFLAVWSTLVVGLADNFLRPFLARGDSQLNGSLVFFCIVGSLAMFGTIGLVLGPLALSAFVTLLELWRSEVASPNATLADRAPTR
jgi:predicted PurR-regulated permease PerM